MSGDKEFPSNKTFLVLEDMETLRNQMVSDLKSIGVKGKIVEAINVAEAIEKSKNEEVEFFISDWNLPDSTGFEFLKKLRASTKYSKTPFIMCTTHNEINYMLDAIKNGANDYLVKPWEVSDLSKKVQAVWKSFLKKNP
jgi:two-component system chemotaxis response regulator CheY